MTNGFGYTIMISGFGSMIKGFGCMIMSHGFGYKMNIMKGFRYMICVSFFVWVFGGRQAQDVQCISSSNRSPKTKAGSPSPQVGTMTVDPEH